MAKIPVVASNIRKPLIKHILLALARGRCTRRIEVFWAQRGSCWCTILPMLWPLHTNLRLHTYLGLLLQHSVVEYTPEMLLASAVGKEMCGNLANNVK